MISLIMLSSRFSGVSRVYLSASRFNEALFHGSGVNMEEVGGLRRGGLAFILFYVLFQVFSGYSPVSSLFVGAEAAVVCS